MSRGFDLKDLELLENSQKVSPLLAELYEHHQKAKSADISKPRTHSKIASVFGDLLVLDISDAERDLITDILLTLVRQAEVDLRQAVSERLSTIKDIPLKMVFHLANDKIEVADPVLRRSNVLTDIDLIHIIKKQSKEHWRSIAMRPHISSFVVGTLIDKRDVPTAINLACNKNIDLSVVALQKLADLAKKNEQIAKPLIMREEVSVELAMKLYDHVSVEIKSYIKRNFDMASARVAERIVDNIVYDLSFIDKDENTPTDKMIEKAELLLRRKTLRIDLMVDHFRQGKTREFIAMFSVYTGLPVPTMLEILQQDHGQGLAVACKATSIKKAEFVNIFLLSARLRRSNVITQHVLAKALSYFDKIQYDDARNILNQSRH